VSEPIEHPARVHTHARPVRREERPTRRSPDRDLSHLPTRFRSATTLPTGAVTEGLSPHQLKQVMRSGRPEPASFEPNNGPSKRPA
jgi:hypothetical protein